MRRRALVSGCFDLLHSGHVEFLQRAAVYGDLYVSVGSDATVVGLKGKRPVCGQDERVFMLRALSCVCDAFVASGTGQLDFLPDMDRIKPDLFIVNDDGETWAKHQVCADRGIGYVVLPRDPHKGLPARSTTALRGVCEIPYRIDLAGGWLDQPWVSQHAPGSVITLSIEPTREFNHRSGMATSTREKARQMWGSGLPDGDRLEIARNLFGAENPPGTPRLRGRKTQSASLPLGLCNCGTTANTGRSTQPSALTSGRYRGWTECCGWLSCQSGRMVSRCCVSDALALGVCANSPKRPSVAGRHAPAATQRH